MHADMGALTREFVQLGRNVYAQPTCWLQLFYVQLCGACSAAARPSAGCIRGGSSWRQWERQQQPAVAAVCQLEWPPSPASF